MGTEGVGTEGVGSTWEGSRKRGDYSRVHSPLSSAVLEGLGTCLSTMSLTTTSQQQKD